MDILVNNLLDAFHGALKVFLLFGTLFYGARNIIRYYREHEGEDNLLVPILIRAGITAGIAITGLVILSALISSLKIA